MTQFVVDTFALSPQTLSLFVATAFFAFFVSAVLGIGAALILMPVLMLELPAPVAIALAAPTMLASNALKAVVFRKAVHWRAVLLSSSTALPFALGSAFFTNQVSSIWLKTGLALVILGSLIVPRLWQHYAATPPPLDDTNPVQASWTLTLWGALIGTLSGMSGAPGPAVALSLRSVGLIGERFVGTIAVQAVALQLVKLPAYVVTGALPRQIWPLALMLSAAAFLAVPLGRVVLRRIDPARFRVLLDVLLALIAIWLLVGVWRATP